MDIQEPLFYSPPLTKNRVFLPVYFIIIITVIVLAAWLLLRWIRLERQPSEPVFECTTSTDCKNGEICSSINTCELYLAPF